MALQMRLVSNIIATSRNGPTDIVSKFIENNKHLTDVINVKHATTRVAELYKKHLETANMTEGYQDYLVYTSIDWISDHESGTHGRFKYIIFTYRMPNGKTVCFKYMF
jgi:hypothetical protein